jgi:hypothetical protein
MKKILILGIILFNYFAVHSQLPSFSRYCNARFDYCIDYPKNILHPLKESDNGDGRIFANSLGENKLLVFGGLNFDDSGNPKTIEQLYNESIIGMSNEGTITFKRLAHNHFYISGQTIRGQIFYRATIIKKNDIGDNVYATAILIFDEDEKELYESVYEDIFRMFM